MIKAASLRKILLCFSQSCYGNFNRSAQCKKQSSFIIPKTPTEPDCSFSSFSARSGPPTAELRNSGTAPGPAAESRGTSRSWCSLASARYLQAVIKELFTLKYSPLIPLVLRCQTSFILPFLSCCEMPDEVRPKDHLIQYLPSLSVQ